MVHLEYLTKVNTVSWGSGVLAFLYRSIYLASRGDSREIYRSLVLFQVLYEPTRRVLFFFTNIRALSTYSITLTACTKCKNKVSNLINLSAVVTLGVDVESRHPPHLELSSHRMALSFAKLSWNVCLDKLFITRHSTWDAHSMCTLAHTQNGQNCLTFLYY